MSMHHSIFRARTFRFRNCPF